MKKIEEDGLKEVAGGMKKDIEDVKGQAHGLHKKLDDQADPPEGGSPDPETEDTGGGTQDLM